jgi:hypothetical protein
VNTEVPEDAPTPARPATRRRIALAVAGLLAAGIVAFLILGSGDGGDGGDNGFQVKQSLVGKGAEAGGSEEAEDYVPTGELVADSGFRPNKDGFGFENYGNEERPENLTPASVEGLFGDQVCIAGTGDACKLTPAAAEWMKNQNESMGGGHCEGFSIAALRMWHEDLDQEDYGAGTTSALEIKDNRPLQGVIAKHFVYQVLPSIVKAKVTGKPSEVLDALMDALKTGDELYTLGIYKPDLTGGHAITPYAVEDKGGGKYAILVYDNNFPGITRAVELDSNKEQWSYVGGTNPDDLGQVYRGNAKTETLELDPATPGDDLQACPFCRGQAAASGPGRGSRLPKNERYTEITLGGEPRNHPHLVFRDDDGRRTGFVNGKFIQEIPDVEVLRTYAVRNWEGAPEPKYRVPEGSEYHIDIDGTKLKKATTASLDLVGDGRVTEVRNIRLDPGQSDVATMSNGGYSFSYLPDGKSDRAPDVYAGFEYKGSAYRFYATGRGFKPGSESTLSLSVAVTAEEDRIALLETTGKASEGLGGRGFFSITLTKTDASGRTSKWEAKNFRLNIDKKEMLTFSYDDPAPQPGKSVTIERTDVDFNVLQEFKALPVGGPS